MAATAGPAGEEGVAGRSTRAVRRDAARRSMDDAKRLLAERDFLACFGED